MKEKSSIQIHVLNLIYLNVSFVIFQFCVLHDLSTQYCKEKVHTFAPEIFL